MKTTINITATDQDLDRFTDLEDLRQFYRGKDIDGLELMLCGSERVPEKICADDIFGIHLGYYPSWMDLWRGDLDGLAKEYGDRAAWEAFYGGSTRECILASWRRELELAHRIGAQYVVFHVSECTLEECLTYKPRYTDREVCAAAAEMINALMDGTPYRFAFLVENLWWSGLNLKDPEVTRELMDSIHYPGKGIMLDTGHLLSTNTALRTQEEGVGYIHSVLDDMGDLCRYIRGIHLHQSLSGEYVESVVGDPPALRGTYWERLSQVYSHILKIDRHKPFTAPGVAELIRRIDPDFLTYELISRSREEHEAMLTEQLRAINENGGIR